MKKLIASILFIIMLGVVLEGVFRIYHRVVYSSWDTDQYELFAFKYPGLDKLDSYEYQKGKKNVLILGGSVVFEDTASYKVGAEYKKATFCGFKEQDSSWNIINLAFPGHTTLDSRFKMEFVKDYKFDYVFIYHGINDTRSNNITKSQYNIDYKHIGFYDEMWTLLRHKEIGVFVSPFYLEIFYKRIKAALGLKSYIPKEFLSFVEEEDLDVVANYFSLPAIRPSIISFQRNLNAIIEKAFVADIKPILCTYAFYQPEEYSYQKFMNGELDYSNKLFPTELYGNPIFVPTGIIGHNHVVVRTAKKHRGRVVFVDFEAYLEKNRTNFMDICHLTTKGCTSMYKNLFEKIEEDSN